MTNVAWGFLYSEPEYVDASARAAVTPKPVYSTSRQLANGDLEVVYKVENPAELKIVADKNVSVMALTGTYQNEEAKDTTVTSDYAAILPAVVTFKAIAFNTLGRFILIVENNGAIANMQDDAMVEVVCELGINGPRPMRVGNIPQFYLGLLVQQVSCEKVLVDAFFENSYQKALQAFTLNRLINDAKVARTILDELIEANKGMWPELK